MVDIADAMGVSRQTIYRLFETRTLLLEYIATARVEVLTRKVVQYLSGYRSLAEALVDGLVYAIRLGREDELLREIIKQDGDAHFKTFLFGGTPEVQAFMREVWRPFIASARERGELPSAANDDQIIEWFCNVGAVLNLREDYAESDHRRILKQFVLPLFVSKP